MALQLLNFDPGKRPKVQKFKSACRAVRPVERWLRLFRGAKAKNRITGATVALKKVQIFEMMDAKARSDCIKEIELLQQVRHTNVIAYLGSFIACNELYIVLELAGAGDLSRMIDLFRRQRKLMPEAIIWRYFVQVCAGLEHMHARRVMHRDIKPANVFITADGVVKLGDLGFGRFFSSGTTVAHSLLGTPSYMSPERIKQEGYNLLSDLWSLGCVLYEMAVLQSPFYSDGISLVTLCSRIESCVYPQLPAGLYTRELGQLVASCIVVDPAKRPSIVVVHAQARGMNEFFMARAQQLKSEQRRLAAMQQQQAGGQEQLAAVRA